MEGENLAPTASLKEGSSKTIKVGSGSVRNPALSGNPAASYYAHWGEGGAYREEKSY